MIPDGMAPATEMWRNPVKLPRGHCGMRPRTAKLPSALGVPLAESGERDGVPDSGGLLGEGAIGHTLLLWSFWSHPSLSKASANCGDIDDEGRHLGERLREEARL